MKYKNYLYDNDAGYEEDRVLGRDLNLEKELVNKLDTVASSAPLFRETPIVLW